MFEKVSENSHFVVISKDPNVSFHKEKSEELKDKEHDSFINEIKKAFSCNLYPVHRLDKITSGILLFAKTPDVARELGELFSQKKIKKTYLALSNKRPHKKQGHIKGDLIKTRQGSYRLDRSLNNPSITSFKSISLEDRDKPLRLFILFPKTGKTHQLRVVMKSLGSPIIGDMRYGNDQADRAYLHCYSLEFELDGIKHFFKSYPKHGNYFEAFKEQIINFIEDNHE